MWRKHSSKFNKLVIFFLIPASECIIRWKRMSYLKSIFRYLFISTVKLVAFTAVLKRIPKKRW